MPSYTQDEFLRLVSSVNAQGGQYTGASHDVVVHDELKADDAKGGPATQNCGEPALFEIPYEPMGNSGTLDLITMCAVDDLMGLMPRFADANAMSGLI